MFEWIAPSLQREPTWEVDTFGDEEKATVVELFMQCDKDGSGVLEMSEIDQLLTKLVRSLFGDVRPINREQLTAMKQSILAKYDKNHDSALSLDEFIAMIAHIKALSDGRVLPGGRLDLPQGVALRGRGSRGDLRAGPCVPGHVLHRQHRLPRGRVPARLDGMRGPRAGG